MNAATKVLLFGSCILAVGCSTPTDPIEIDLAGVVPAGPEEVLVSGGSRRIVVQGTISVGMACPHDLDVELQEQSASLSLRIIATFDSQLPCPAVEALQPYRLEVSDISPGLYQVTVIHANQPGVAERRFEQSITVTE